MRRTAAYVLLSVVAIVLVTGTGSYSAVEADRTVTAKIVDDDDSYMSIDNHETFDLYPGGGAASLEFLEVQNNFYTTVNATVTAEMDARGGVGVEFDQNLTSEGWNDHLDPGDDSAFALGVTCRATGEQGATFAYDVGFNSSSVESETTESREIELDVHCPTVSTGNGGGTATVNESFTLLGLGSDGLGVTVSEVSVDSDAISAQPGGGAVTAQCTEPTDGAETVEVEVDGYLGDGIDFEKSEEVSVTCEEKATPTPTGNATANGAQNSTGNAPNSTGNAAGS